MIKNLIKVTSALALLLFVFRGPAYRFSVKYKEVGQREYIKITNQSLLEKIESKTANKNIQLQEIISIADQLTTEELAFTTKKASGDPNKLSNTNRANCIGYAAMFNSIANTIIESHGLSNSIMARHKIGHLYLMGYNVHPLLDNPFFKDHDFNTIRNLKTNDSISIDATVSDYLWIETVADL